jgi:RecB family exonuclease
MLEQLGQCGFRFFSRRLLGLAPDEPAVLEVRANEQGTLVHEVLARFVAEHPELPPDPAAAREIARTFVARVRVTMGRTLPADAAFLDLAWIRIGLALEELAALEAPQRAQLAAEGVVVERRLEQPFSVPFGSEESGVVVLKGTPDRVEVHRRGGVVEQARILDYKASRNPATYRTRLDPEAQQLGTALQIPLYVLATLAQDRALEAADLEAGFLVLLAASGEKEQVRRVDRDVLERVRQRIVSLIAAAHGGHFDVDPALCDPFCPYRGVCRYQPPPLEEDELRDA